MHNYMPLKILVSQGPNIIQLIGIIQLLNISAYVVKIELKKQH